MKDFFGSNFIHTTKETKIIFERTYKEKCILAL